MRRDIHDFFLSWKEQTKRKPLLLRGARQIGKSFAVKVLGEEFSNYIELNFEKRPEFIDVFEKDLDPKRIISDIEILVQEKIIPGKTLLFFDEIQQCPNALMAMRYFYEDMAELHLIGAGSLLDFELENISMPVGRITPVYMKPVSFKEFLEAKNEGLLVEAIKNANHQKPLSSTIHEKALDLVRDYMFVGGMPEAVENYINDKNIKSVIQIQEEIISVYRSDFNKYAKKNQIPHLNTIIESLTQTIAQKVTYSKISPELQARELKKAINLLNKANLISLIRSASANGFPLGASASIKHFKLLFLDTGLFQKLCRMDYFDFKYNKSISASHAGKTAEQYVGQELLNLNGFLESSELYYWQRQKKSSTAEIDYLLEISSNIFPIEVKSGYKNHMKSMEIFLNEHKNRKIGIKISPNNFALSKSVLSIPLYAVFNLKNYLKEF